MEIIKAKELVSDGVSCGTPDEQELALINGYTLRALSAEEVFVFSLILCDNEIDRDGERFDIPTLSELAGLFLGKSGVFDHSVSAQKQTARIFSCKVMKDPLRRTAAGEEYRALKARAYMLRGESTKNLIAELEAGIKKEVSVGCAVRHVLCSVCGQDLRAAPCGHRTGEPGPDGGVCHRVLSGAIDAYEWSFVAVPAQRNAGVTKSHPRRLLYGEADGGELEDILARLGDRALNAGEAAKIKAAIGSLSRHARYAQAMRVRLEDEVVRLAFAQNPAADCVLLKKAACGMEPEELEEFKRLFEAREDNYLSAIQLLPKAPGQDGNTQYKI